MGAQCAKLAPCCWNSQVKAAVLEAPNIGGVKLNIVLICLFGCCSMLEWYS